MSEQWPTRPVSSARAWLGVVLVPVLFFAGVVLAHVVAGELSDDVTGERRSVVADLIGMVMMVVAVTVPALGAWQLGRRAEVSGNPRGRWPRLAGAVLGGAAVLWVLLSIVGNAATGRYAG